MAFRWTDENKLILQQRYPKEGPEILASVLGTSINGIQKMASRLALRYEGRYKKIVDTRARRKTNVDIHFFDSWNPDMAYVSGYAWADVGIGQKSVPCSFRVNCSKEDEDIARQIQSILKTTHKWTEEPARIRNDGRSSGPMIRLVITNHLLVKPLIETQGMLPRKSYLDLEFPSVPEDYLGHFCRGYLDGDGSACPDIKFNGSEKFIRTLQKRIVAACGVPSWKISPHRSIWRVEWGAKKDILTLYHFLYPEGTYLYGRRKRSLLETYLGIP